MGFFWTKEEIEILVSTCHTQSRYIDLITYLPRRTRQTIKHKVRELNLKLKVTIDEARFWSKVNKNSGIFGESGKYPTECWIWIAGIQNDGYGSFKSQKRTIVAHKFIYENNIAKVEDDKELDHLCRVRNCVRPDHLQPVTHLINARRGNSGLFNRNKTHCKQGHEFTSSNTYITTDKHRECRTCRTIAYQKCIQQQKIKHERPKA